MAESLLDLSISIALPRFPYACRARLVRGTRNDEGEKEEGQGRVDDPKRAG